MQDSPFTPPLSTANLFPPFLPPVFFSPTFFQLAKLPHFPRSPVHISCVSFLSSISDTLAERHILHLSSSSFYIRTLCECILYRWMVDCMQEWNSLPFHFPSTSHANVMSSGAQLLTKICILPEHRTCTVLLWNTCEHVTFIHSSPGLRHFPLKSVILP